MIMEMIMNRQSLFARFNVVAYESCGGTGSCNFLIAYDSCKFPIEEMIQTVLKISLLP